MTVIRVLIGEDDASFRAALVDLLGSDPAFELVGAAVDAEETIALARKLDPDVVLLDVKMPAGGGPTAARAIRTWCPNTRTLALTAYHDRATMMEMLRAGAAGYLVKGSSVDEILDAIVRTAAGESTLSSDAAGTLLQEISSQLQSEERDAEEGRRRSAQIDEALAGRGLSMEFQPIFDIRTGAVVGTEALARFTLEPASPTPDPAAWFAEASPRLRVRSSWRWPPRPWSGWANSVLSSSSASTSPPIPLHPGASSTSWPLPPPGGWCWS